MATQHLTFLTLLHQNLRVLRAREVRFAGDAPLDLLNQITDHEQAIALTEAAQTGQVGEAAWREGLAPLLVRQPADFFGAVTVIYNLPEAPASTSASARPAVDEGQAICPYRGLFAFRPEDAAYFFGRVADTADLVEAVAASRLTTVLGASGSGKSSLVFAGLVPALDSAGGWRFTTFRPGNDPFLGLAGALTPLYETGLSKTDQLLEARKLANGFLPGDLPPGDVLALIRQSQPEQQLLLIADQFEELYTLCPQPTTRRQFLDLLLALVEQARAYNLHLLLTLRADFLGQASLYPPFAEALKTKLVLLRPMTRVELAEAVEQPAALQGLRFEDGLVARLLDDVGEAEGSLPLLEFALTELWQRRQDARLTHAAYAQIGGVNGALSEHADAVFRRLEPAEQEQARRVFIQLVQPGAGTGDTRRLATQPEIKADWTLVARLADERLIVTNRPEGRPETVEVVHEALIRHWGQLQRWLEADREFRAWQEGLRGVMRQWQAANQDEGALLRGALLAVAQEQLTDREADLSEAEIEFIQASLAHEQAEQAMAEARRQRELQAARQLAAEAEARRQTEVQASANLRRGAIWLAGIGGVAVVFAVAAGFFGISANRTAQIALSRQLAAQAQARLDENPQLALLVALEGQAVGQTDETASVIAQAPYQFPPLTATLQGHTGPVYSVAWSPDGQQLASGSGDGTVIVWDTVSGEARTTLRGHTGPVYSMAWSPDGQQLASGAEDETIDILQSWALQPPCELVTRNLTLEEWDRYLPGRPYHATCPNWPLDPAYRP